MRRQGLAHIDHIAAKGYLEFFKKPDHSPLRLADLLLVVTRLKLVAAVSIFTYHKLSNIRINSALYDRLPTASVYFSNSLRGLEPLTFTLNISNNRITNYYSAGNT